MKTHWLKVGFLIMTRSLRIFEDADILEELNLSTTGLKSSQCTCKFLYLFCVLISLIFLGLNLEFRKGVNIIILGETGNVHSNGTVEDNVAF